METQEFISIEMFSRHHDVEISFIHSLQEFGLIEVNIVNEVHCIEASQLSEIEKMVRLHNELQINTEGIDAIIKLLLQIKNMEKEIAMLKSRLNLYERVESL